jgi:uncharacterized protein YndB with AHSA1/START domain
MTSPQTYSPKSAFGASVKKTDGDKWTLVLTRELHHPPAKVWKALTDPEQLRAWAPFDSDRSLGAVGTAKLTTVGVPGPHVTEAKITRADAPRVLEYDWGGQDMKWQLDPVGADGTRLTLWANIDKRYIAMGAAGWHICIDVMDRVLSGIPTDRLVGPETMHFEGWQRLNKEYASQFAS